MLTIETYNASESLATDKLGLRAAQAYSPATFEDLNYPVRVNEMTQLLRYVDTMHETSDGKYFDKAQFQYSKAEGKTISHVAQVATDLTEQAFGKRIRPWMAPFGAVPTFRIIEAFKKQTKSDKLRVLEIGPGSGYLGALLIERGFDYASMDNTQGFYLWQNHLYNALAPGEVKDWASEQTLPAKWDARINHVAWWQWAGLDQHSTLDCDVIVCDHALGEFHPIALRHTLRVIRNILKGDGPKLFFFTSPGREHYSDINAIGRACIQSGMELLFYKGFFGFTVPESSLSQYAIRSDHAFKTHFEFKIKRLFSPLRSGLGGSSLEDLELRIPPVDHKSGDPMIGGAEIIPLNKDEEPIDYPFLKMAGFKSPMDIV